MYLYDEEDIKYCIICIKCIKIIHFIDCTFVITVGRETKICSAWDYLWDGSKVVDCRHVTVHT